MLALACAFLLDVAVGDPGWFPHPVRLFGAAAACVDRLRRRIGLDLPLGLLLAVGLPALAGWGAYAGIAWAAGKDARAGFAAEVAVLWTCLAARSMASHARAVERALRAGDLPAARAAVGRIVGRETSSLDETGVARAAVESVAESAVDGVLSPLFWAAAGGAFGFAAPAALAFKAVSTLDSAVGYRTGGYAAFGWASARLDDVANWIPARLSVPLTAMAAALCGRDARGAWRTGVRDGGKSPSPNAGRPEAAFAGALGVRLGGPMERRGTVEERPFLGEGGRVPDAASIGGAVDLLWAVSLLGLLAALAGLWACENRWRPC